MYNKANDFSPYEKLMAAVYNAINPAIKAPQPPPPSSHHCFWEDLIEAVVAVVIMILVPEAMGITAASSAWAVAGANLVAGALASAVQQGMAISFGQQDGFSLKEMLAYAVTAGATAGLAKPAGLSDLIGQKGIESFVEAFAETVEINATVQLLEMSVGLQGKFNFKSMVEQSVAEVLSAKISLKMQNENFALRAAAEETSSAILAKSFGYHETAETLAANYLGDAVNDANADYLGQKVKAQNQTAISDEPKLNNSNVTSLNANMNSASMNAELNYVSQSLSEDNAALGEENSEATFYTGFHQTTQKAQNSLNQASFFAQQARSTSQSTPHSAIGALSQAVYDHQDSWWAKGVMGLAAAMDSNAMQSFTHMMTHDAELANSMNPVAYMDEAVTHRDIITGQYVSETEAWEGFATSSVGLFGGEVLDAAMPVLGVAARYVQGVGAFSVGKAASYMEKVWGSEVGAGSSAQAAMRSRVIANIAETSASINATNFGVHAAVEKIPYLDISTHLNEATFWSGPGNRELAETFANFASKRTIEMTPGGQYLESLKLFDKFPGRQAIIPWERLSLRFAQNASGNISAFVKGARSEGVFSRIEYPALLNNPRVTDIVFSPEYENAKIYRF